MPAQKGVGETGCFPAEETSDPEHAEGERKKPRVSWERSDAGMGAKAALGAYNYLKNK